jgi:hypothetical protein
MQDDGRSALNIVASAIGNALLMIGVWVVALGACWWLILWLLGAA